MGSLSELDLIQSFLLLLDITGKVLFICIFLNSILWVIAQILAKIHFLM